MLSFALLVTVLQVEEQALGDEPSTYPENLTVANMLYFMAAPTLCYQVRAVFSEETQEEVVQCKFGTVHVGYSTLLVQYTSGTVQELLLPGLCFVQK